MNRIMCMVAVLGAATTLHAQQTYNDSVRTHVWSVYVQGGVSGYHGLRGTQYDSKQYVAPAVDLGVTYTIKPWVRIGLNAGYTYFKNADKTSMQSYSTQGTGTAGGREGTSNTDYIRVLNRNMVHAMELDANVEFNIMDLWHHRRAQHFNLWGGLGVGWAHTWATNFNTWLSDTEIVARADSYFNVEDQINITSNRTFAKGDNIIIPIRLKAEYDIVPQWSVGLEGSFNILPLTRLNTPKNYWTAGAIVRYNFVGKDQRMVKPGRMNQALADLEAARLAQENCEKSSQALQSLLDEANAKNRALQNDNDRLRNQPKPEPVKVIEGGIVYFENADAELTAAGQEIVNRVAEGLKSDRTKEIILIGSASTPGSFGYNKNLSKNRVQTVKKALMDAGVQESQISETYAVGEYGMTAEDSCRRVVISVK